MVQTIARRFCNVAQDAIDPSPACNAAAPKNSKHSQNRSRGSWTNDLRKRDEAVTKNTNQSPGFINEKITSIPKPLCTAKFKKKLNPMAVTDTKSPDFPNNQFEDPNSTRWILEGHPTLRVNASQLKNCLSLLLKIIESGEFSAIENNEQLNRFLEKRSRHDQQMLALFGLKHSPPSSQNSYPRYWVENPFRKTVDQKIDRQ